MGPEHLGCLGDHLLSDNRGSAVTSPKSIRSWNSAAIAEMAKTTAISGLGWRILCPRLSSKCRISVYAAALSIIARFRNIGLFGLEHAYQGWIGAARTTVIGCGFGVAFAVTHSLWWLLIAHGSANLSGVLLARKMLCIRSPTD